ncbi:hypothetical protein Cch01nite_32390 [Cellulomonas chitinilytica]|uniref:DUF1269 domain-containing protein n=1 Tax=Cellulomonas chitinilytica TaxID=398759 RepID=A0A919P5B8_9CELL|nr:DUF6325 family protein [Cellulomonas chitinilytica]GIG22515.1 hypothetical protein Cch01nite_32390 [Cellulomonas chitinilytica]
MAEVFGPVDLYAIGFPEERVPERVRDELLALIASDAVRIVDLVVVRKSLDGDLTVIEVEDFGDELQITDVELAGAGLTGGEDVDEIGAGLPPGGSALVAVVEHVWARGFVAAAREAGAIVLASERIPAEVVNALVELDELAGESTTE